MTTYTITRRDGEVEYRGLSPESAAVEIMSADGNEHEVRLDGEAWALFTSDFSRNSPSYRGLTRSRILSFARDEATAATEIYAAVIRNANWFRGFAGQEVYTDEAYDAMIAELAAEEG